MTTTTLPSDDAASFPKTEVNRVKRAPDRGRYDKETIYAILDAALVCHIAYVVDGRPFCTPTSFWREGDHVTGTARRPAGWCARRPRGSRSA